VVLELFLPDAFAKPPLILEGRLLFQGAFPGAEELTSPDRAVATAIFATFQMMFAAPAMPSVDAGLPQYPS
jgi:hypothetical protein